jgi:hypothetical protein
MSAPRLKNVARNESESFVPRSEKQPQADPVLDLLSIVLAERKDVAEFVASHRSTQPLLARWSAYRRRT